MPTVYQFTNFVLHTTLFFRFHIYIVTKYIMPRLTVTWGWLKMFQKNLATTFQMVWPLQYLKITMKSNLQLMHLIVWNVLKYWLMLIITQLKGRCISFMITGGKFFIIILHNYLKIISFCPPKKNCGFAIVTYTCEKNILNDMYLK